MKKREDLLRQKEEDLERKEREFAERMEKQEKELAKKTNEAIDSGSSINAHHLNLVFVTPKIFVRPISHEQDQKTHFNTLRQSTLNIQNHADPKRRFVLCGHLFSS